MTTPYLSLGIFIDGGYLAKVNEALAGQLGMHIHMGSLFRYIRRKLASIYDFAETDCQIVESHYFRGRFRAETENRMHLLYNERKFEDTLIENDVIFHYKHLRQVENNGKKVIIEKGVDVWFALEAYELALLRKFDFVVLMTGDADHEMLVKKLKALKTRVVLLTWNLGEQSSTSRFLTEEVCHHIELSEMVLADRALLNDICTTNY